MPHASHSDGQQPAIISRRALLLGATALAGAGAAAVLGSGRASAALQMKTEIPARSPLGLADDLHNPREVHSVNGRFRHELTMRMSDYELPYAKARLRLYEGEIPGPTFRVHPGDEMEITLHNNMPPNRDSAAPVLNTPNQLNSTNLHFHGFHVSPKANSDNVYLQINPGESFNYVVRLPEDHPAGNYWYHPHRHGSVALQVASGCGGMMIVEGTLDEVPEIAAAIERVLVFQSPVVDPKSEDLESYDTIWSLDAERFWLVNGQFRPRIYIRAGEVQHWRMLNAGDQQFLPLQLAGLELHEVGFDGNPYPAARETDEIFIAPGNRMNLMVKAGAPGVYTLVRPAFRQGKMELPEVQMADVIVLPTGSDKVAADVKMGTALPSGPLPKNRILTDITDDEIDNRRQIVLGVTDTPGMFKNTVFTLNGQPFDPRRDDIVARLGQAEEWEFVNTTPFPHPIHVHVNPMQVVALNGVPLAYKHWQDTIPVPAGGTATVRMRFEDFDGRFVMHCHILPHEDLGMMLNVAIQA
ncbi:Multicopper oxidase with three cupredoxin domains (includes cell division protein FtsP and spore coat protein CotA) [Paracoccus isoporae]|uniref:Multicopper oxidase with three cupredoxin domains (Includes cell division protein FtsP and spore coat protein CotA) n=1 Tax=Paracoccus isoporae TaxID=591205 RepID=A0A1G7F7Z6_9RHOB|nr:multicopper oxidase family protein [Paracoccus isoporae]SDE71991.1 Multicopper oxidase with three cupredoxin domains (includes cell division protein FtsP and spore coat protein CotA) [Paracoccus isoporae]